ncbi:MAG: hypothetical protein CMK83_06115 [Pseudomonadales bacterium]|uniref:hypothetical protein n=1 Tax=unclassified Ketobacter TaxID=2639109 RepID=UPI000C49CD4B|nr:MULTISPECIES: hypothetical protein [unclassified Ketobacter]MAQ23775.1 hypothetical protein [Pseudomonadales bacterium]HAG95856.1 hypothetical protein [Gammaproteobacteria bacterium]MBI26240.1 hypothetical protein [Pseudomonadales bacterium]RLT89631.1 MAG: hypothetical protein D9N13_11970 [Ketobacter sp. GenoA1]RLT92384.1 MAG: hypothetical protein D9N15_22700 [Ketobacter sp.]|tara:strand:+ start:25719 stop:26459 length:741 start_codon:yes stop_codon:yes gene_type:complete
MNARTGFTSALVIGCSLAGCSTNTKMDDAAYRSIGQQAPKQVQNYVDDQLQSQGAKVDTSSVPVPDFPGETTQLNYESRQPAATGSHLVRYGHPKIIDKVVKTARIHCQPLAFQINTTGNSFWGKEKGTLQQCTYRFPQHCGAHQFSILSYGKKTILIYQPPEQNHYVIDTLQGTPKSQLGLWDQDDHLGSSTTNANYLFQSDYNANYQQPFNPVNLGWIIKASHQDEAEFGKLYHRALEEITGCF